MVKSSKKLMCAILTLCCIFSSVTSIYAATPYAHDPMQNPKAARDIIVNPNAVYAYSPNPASERLKDYISYDWSDTALVSEFRAEREAYHQSIAELYTLLISMRAAGYSTEDIARTICERRNILRLEAYKDNPDGLAKVKKSNLETYGNENGGTPDFFYNKYGSWEKVIEKALSANAGADACLGLYDEYYDTYIANGLYTVKKGDNLSSIAASELGDRELWVVIYDINRDKISNPSLIYPSQQLMLVR